MRLVARSRPRIAGIAATSLGFATLLGLAVINGFWLGEFPSGEPEFLPANPLEGERIMLVPLTQLLAEAEEGEDAVMAPDFISRHMLEPVLKRYFEISGSINKGNA